MNIEPMLLQAIHQPVPVVSGLDGNALQIFLEWPKCFDDLLQVVVMSFALKPVVFSVNDANEIIA